MAYQNSKDKKNFRSKIPISKLGSRGPSINDIISMGGGGRVWGDRLNIYACPHVKFRYSEKAPKF